jgi:fumarate hydratase subunit alpha
MEDIYSVIAQTANKLYYDALRFIPEDVIGKLESAYTSEDNEQGRKILGTILKNIRTATENDLLVCQDTGTPVFLVEVGDIQLSVYRLIESIREGVRQATIKNSLRPNMVDPLTRKNTGDNTGKASPIVHIEVNKNLEQKVRIVAMPKGSGSENMSAVAMLTPAQGVNGVKKFVLKTVAEAGGKGCPPYIVGVGIGGNFETVAYLAKKAALRRLGSENSQPVVAELERELLGLVNQLGVGPMGVGGRVTAISLNIETAETHISSLPVAVNIQCWRGERAEAIIEPDLKVKVIR